MTVIRERALIARALLLEIAVLALIEAGTLDLDAIYACRMELAARWPGGVDPEQLLDTGADLAARTRDDAHRALAMLSLLDDEVFEPVVAGQRADRGRSAEV